MNWILDHLQLVLAVAGGFAWWLNQRRQADKEPPPHESKTFEDPELAARTRRIREEIQRKIEQRARGYAEPAPTTASAVDEPPPVIRDVAVPRGAGRLDAQRQAEILEEQAAMMERLREAEVMKAAAQKRLAFESATADHTPELLARTRSTVVDGLHDPAALRRAFILREVLGPPVALR